MTHAHRIRAAQRRLSASLEAQTMDKQRRWINWCTSGEWMIGMREDDDGAYPLPGEVYDGMIVAVRADEEGFPDGTEIAAVSCEADARMMAASKDLYAELGKALQMLRTYLRPSEYVYLASMEEAMNKATRLHDRAPISVLVQP